MTDVKRRTASMMYDSFPCTSFYVDFFRCALSLQGTRRARWSCVSLQQQSVPFMEKRESPMMTMIHKIPNDPSTSRKENVAENIFRKGVRTLTQTKVRGKTRLGSFSSCKQFSNQSMIFGQTESTLEHENSPCDSEKHFLHVESLSRFRGICESFC